MKNTYSFYGNYFKITNNKDDIKLNYHKLYKIFETENYFYLYIDKNHSFVLAKSGFNFGNPSEFYKFIKKKIW